MKYVILCAMVLCSCAASDFVHGEYCESIGYKFGTDEFHACRKAEQAKTVQARRQRQLAGVPEPDSGNAELARWWMENNQRNQDRQERQWNNWVDGIRQDQRNRAVGDYLEQQRYRPNAPQPIIAVPAY